ncbi:hypothetical protein AB0K09_15885, partial [Streptomyces sp. NPDC049577]|uniref:hypothetical protein n=1 Tax=Streptomyces sp. NPDC049577 TaxID=3155153 RepID=UPI003439BFBA
SASSWRAHQRRGWDWPRKRDLEWVSAAPDSTDRVIGSVDEAQKRGESAGVSLYNSEAGTGGLLLIFRDGTQASFSPSINRRSLGAAKEMTDLPWYVSAMVPTLYEIGLTGYEARDIAD